MQNIFLGFMQPNQFHSPSVTGESLVVMEMAFWGARRPPTKKIDRYQLMLIERRQLILFKISTFLTFTMKEA